MSRFDTAKAKDAILGHAASNGWSVQHNGELNITLTRQPVKIAVRFGKTGDILSASVLGVRSLGTGRSKGKLDAVIEELNREP